MANDDSSGMVFDGTDKHFTGVNEGPIEKTDGDQVNPNNLLGTVERDYQKRFLCFVGITAKTWKISVEPVTPIGGA